PNHDFDGGDGIDEFTFSTTDLAELVKILGVSGLTITDPEIRVTDLATGRVTFHGFVVGTEAITVQAGDGDDQIVLDDRNGGLGGIHFSIFGQGGDNTTRMYEAVL